MSALIRLFVAVFLASGLGSYASRRMAAAVGAIDQPTGGRKIHTRSTPLLGGIGIGFVILLLLFAAWLTGYGEIDRFPLLQIAGFVLGVVLILVVGFLDDMFGLSASFRFGCYALACLVVVLTGTVITQVSRVGGGAFPLPLWFGASLTFAWMIGVTFAIKVMDGLDGLVTGQTAIGAGLIAALAVSPAFSQPAVATLAVIIGAAYSGFLPFNVHPAKQFLGESGSALAGFCLAFLAVASGAKVATAFMALGLPLVDMALVMMGRVARGVSPMQGDDTHLHFKLLKAGMSHRQVVFLYWGITLLFGLAAFAVQTRGKIVLVAMLVITVVLLSGMASWKLKHRAV